MGQTIERMKEGYSKIRNEALASAFEYMGYIEHWGSGIPRIIEEVTAAGLEEPEFLGGDTDLRINIYRDTQDVVSGESLNDVGNNGLDVAKSMVSRQEIDPDVGITTGLRRETDSDVGITTGLRRETDSGGETVTNDEVQTTYQQRTSILDALRIRHELGIKDIIEVLGVQERQAQRIIRSMADSGLVRRVGAGRTTRYVLPDNNGDERQ